MIKSAVLALLLIPSLAHARRAVMEGLAASNQTVYLDTTTSRLNVSTGSYSGAISGVGLHVSSNVVISNDNTDNIVLYATGTIVAGTWNSASPVFGSSVIFSGRVEASTGAAVFLSTYSFSVVDAQNWTNTGYSSGCLTNSTNTITVAGGMRVRISFYPLQYANTSGSVQSYFRFLEDGAVAHTAANIGACQIAIVAGGEPCGPSVLVRVPSAGQHSYCVQARTDGGTSSLPSGYERQFVVETVP